MNNNSSGGKAIRGLDVLILGFAFFATYFGAGNLIFPPQLGLNSGSDFLSGLAGLTLSGIFLPIFTLIVIGLNGDVHSITERVGKNTYNVLLAALMLVCTRLRHVAGTQWGNKKYMNMTHLEAAAEDASIAG